MANSRHNAIYEFEDYRLDAAQKLLFRGEEQISLAPKTIETLLALVERQGKVVSKDELMRRIWADTAVEESNLSQNLYLLRKTLGATRDGNPFIETLKRRGYRFNGAARVSENGFSTQRREDAKEKEEAKDYAPNESGESQIKNQSQRPSRRVERRGNVLALADWRDEPKESERAAEEKEESSDEARQTIAADSQSKPRFVVAAVSVAAALMLLTVLSFLWFKSPASQINSAVAAKNELTILPLTNGEKLAQATVSPDGKFFAYAEYEVEATHLWLQQVGEASRVEIVEPYGGRIQNLAFAPDSKTIYFLARQTIDEPNALHRVSTLGGAPVKILTDINSPVSFSPDGREFVFERDDRINVSQLVIAASDGTHERIVLTRRDTETIMPYPAWSPDGTQIAFALLDRQPQIDGGCSIVALDLRSESIKPLSAEKYDSCYRMAWTRDGAGLTFVGTKAKESQTTRRDQIYYLDVQTGEARRLTTDGNRYEASSLGVTDAGEILALSYNRASQIWSVDASGDSRTARQITNGQSDGRGGIAPLPDGKIAFLSRIGDGFGVFQTTADGENRQAIISDTPRMEELRAAPDGRFLVFAANADGFVHLFRSDADGANRRQLTFGAGNEVDSTVSPDGSWIVYDSSIFDGGNTRFALRKISSEGGESILLLDERCESPRFSPNGKLIACVDSAEKIRVVSFENGATLETFEPVKSPSLNMGAHWTPDGRNLVYVACQKNAFNLWQQPLSGVEARPLTDFTSDEIYNFAFAPDGSRLYLARGNQVRNALLIKNFK